MTSPELPIKKNKGFRSKKRSGASTFTSYVSHNEDDKDLTHGGRLPSSEGEGLTDGGSSHHSSHGNSPFEGVVTRPGDRMYTRSGRPTLYKTPSVDSISTVTSGVTLKAVQPYDEDITDVLRGSEVQRRGLTEESVKALSYSRFDQQKTSSTKRYSKIRSTKHHGGGDGGNRSEERREDLEYSSG